MPAIDSVDTVPFAVDVIVSRTVNPLLPVIPQWGAADAEIKVPSVENTVLKGSSFNALSRSVYCHAC